MTEAKKCGVRVAVLALFGVALFLLAGCDAGSRRGFYDGDGPRGSEPSAQQPGESVPAPGCKDGHCMRVIETGEYVGPGGYLIPPPRDAR